MRLSRARVQRRFSNSVNDGFSNSVKYDFLKIVSRARESSRQCLDFLNISKYKSKNSKYAKFSLCKWVCACVCVKRIFYLTLGRIWTGLGGKIAPDIFLGWKKGRKNMKQKSPRLGGIRKSWENSHSSKLKPGSLFIKATTSKAYHHHQDHKTKTIKPTP